MLTPRTSLCIFFPAVGRQSNARARLTEANAPFLSSALSSKFCSSGTTLDATRSSATHSSRSFQECVSDVDIVVQWKRDNQVRVHVEVSFPHVCASTRSIAQEGVRASRSKWHFSDEAACLHEAQEHFDILHVEHEQVAA